ncbi:MAG: aromatic ring-hydroxylating dioxygenase subunit alpha [Finegoldia sp.]|nr:aromatic ring-hydroxylating dioxygenase subunit alpha [Finegoldia sp.]
MIKNKWYGILPSKKVKKGDIVGIKRFGTNLVLFRTEDGKLSCLTDVCSHRGASLSQGNIKDNCIKCPFHGLEFNSQGECELVPALGIENQENLDRFNLKSYKVVEKFDIIFVFYGDDEEKSKEPAPFDLLGEYIDDSFVYSELQDPWNTHYSRAIENQLDVVHLPFVHYNTIGRGNKTLVNGPKVIAKDDSLIITSANNEVDHGQKPKANKDAVIKETNLNFLFPNVWINRVSDKIKIVIFFAPVDDENTVLFIRFYNKITGFKPVDKLIAFFGRYGNKVVERQDKRVVINELPKRSSLKMGEHLVPGDLPIIQYRKIREKLIQENNTDGKQKAQAKKIKIIKLINKKTNKTGQMIKILPKARKIVKLKK